MRFSTLLLVLSVVGGPMLAETSSIMEDEKAFLNFVLKEPVPGVPLYSRSGCFIPAMPLVANPPDAVVGPFVRSDEAELLLMNIYRRQVIQGVVASGECSCATHFPGWQSAYDEFVEVTSSVPIEEWGQVTHDSNRAAWRGAEQSHKICKAAGVY